MHPMTPYQDKGEMSIAPNPLQRDITNHVNENRHYVNEKLHMKS